MMAMNRNTMAVPAPGLPLLAAMLLAGAAQAQERTDDLPDPGMLPDHPLYFMTSASEAIGTFFTFGEADKAERALELSERRLAEVRALAEQGKPEAAERAMEASKRGGARGEGQRGFSPRPAAGFPRTRVAPGPRTPRFGRREAGHGRRTLTPLTPREQP